MRIISGTYKGRRFNPPTSITARPTTDFAKESLFNLLNNRMDLEGITALDLFSGTGSISYELVSRGAMHVTAIEMSDKHIAFIKKIIKQLKMDNLRVLRSDVFRFVDKCTMTFDLIFADPPYQMEDIQQIPDKVFKRGCLKEDGVLIVEHGSKTDFSEHNNFVEHRHYGNVHFSFFENK